MAGDRVPRLALDLPQRALELVVRERLDLAAAVAEEVVMVVLSARVDRLEAGGSRADVDALDEAVPAQLLENAVDARDPDMATLGPKPIEDLLGGQATVLRAKQLDHSLPGAAGAVAASSERRDRPLCPAAGRK